MNDAIALSPNKLVKALGKPAAEFTKQDIIRFIEGPISPVKCLVNGEEPDCALRDKCVFIDFWRRAKTAVEGVYDGTTFEDLVREAASRTQSQCANFSI